MDKAFKIATLRILIATALFCIAAGLFLKAERYYHDVVMEDGSGQRVFELIRATAFVAIGAGIGTILRRVLLCVLLVILIEEICATFPTVY